MSTKQHTRRKLRYQLKLVQKVKNMLFVTLRPKKLKKAMLKFYLLIIIPSINSIKIAKTGSANFLSDRNFFK